MSNTQLLTPEFFTQNNQHTHQHYFFTERSKREFSLRGLNKAANYYFEDVGLCRINDTDACQVSVQHGNRVIFLDPESAETGDADIALHIMAVWVGREKHVHQSWNFYYFDVAEHAYFPFEGTNSPPLEENFSGQDWIVWDALTMPKKKHTKKNQNQNTLKIPLVPSLAFFSSLV